MAETVSFAEEGCQEIENPAKNITTTITPSHIKTNERFSRGGRGGRQHREPISMPAVENLASFVKDLLRLSATRCRCLSHFFSARLHFNSNKDRL
jgi:hypothetical protein